MSGAIQVCRFPCGGYCLHKVTGEFSGRVSAWFNPQGDLIEAEQYFGVGGRLARRVEKGCHIWRTVALIGRVYRLPASEIVGGAS